MLCSNRSLKNAGRLLKIRVIFLYQNERAIWRTREIHLCSATGLTVIACHVSTHMHIFFFLNSSQAKFLPHIPFRYTVRAFGTTESRNVTIMQCQNSSKVTKDSYQISSQETLTRAVFSLDTHAGY